MPNHLICVILLCGVLTGCPGDKPKPAAKTTKAVPDPSAKGAAAVVASVNKTKMKACLLAVLNAAKMHKAETGKAPRDMKTLLKAEALTKEQATDLWGNPYVIKARGPKIEVLTYGADGKPGGGGPNSDWSTKDLR